MVYHLLLCFKLIRFYIDTDVLVGGIVILPPVTAY